MAASTAVYARIDSNLKTKAEYILQQLGISPSSAIQMLYSQIVLTRSMPLNLSLPVTKPTAIGAMDPEQLDREIASGFESMKSGLSYTEEEVDANLSRMFGI